MTYLPHTTKTLKFTTTDRFSKKDIFKTVESLGASLLWIDSGSTPLLGEVSTNTNLHRVHVVQELCRKLDTLNIRYEFK